MVNVRVLILILLMPSLSFAVSSHDHKNQDKIWVDFAKSLKATRDISFSLDEILEKETVSAACKRYFSHVDANSEKLPNNLHRDPEVVSDMLQCGKWIFMFGNFSTKTAFPNHVLKALLDVFPDETGDNFEKLGFYTLPHIREYPLGMEVAEGNPWGSVGPIVGKPLTLTCAACHVGQMSDGRYAIGMPNQNLLFGKFNLLMMYNSWKVDREKYEEEKWPKKSQSYYKSMDKVLARSKSPLKFLFQAESLISRLRLGNFLGTYVGLISPTVGELNTYFNLSPNQYYPSSPLFPLGLNKDINSEGMYMSTPTLWDIENFVNKAHTGKFRPLSAFIPTNSLEDFSKAAMIFQTGNQEFTTPKYIDPLALYIRTLSTPKGPSIKSKKLFVQGKRIFIEKCKSCHDGPRGESLSPVSIKKIGTPEILLNPFFDYEPPTESASLAYDNYVEVLGPIKKVEGVYSRPLKGLWSRKKLMLNGSHHDIYESFCLKPLNTDDIHTAGPLKTEIHRDLCYDYFSYEKYALIEFLQAW